MRIGLLGPLRVVADGRDTEVGGARLRVLLTRLSLGVGHIVTPMALTEALWPYEGPSNPDAALHSLVSRLRRTLPGPSAIRSEPAGYRLALPAESVDVVRFERLAVQGRRALRSVRQEDAVDLLREALGLWRGAPLSDTAHLPFAGAAATRLERMRLMVREDLFDAELASPETEPGVRVLELERLVAEHPLRELLMATLAVDGRRAEALVVHEEYRRLLAERLGTDPGRRIRALHLRLLRAEPAPTRALEPPPGVPGRSHTPKAGDGTGRRPGRPPRSALTRFVGREDERATVRDRLLEDRLVTLVGPGGVGKTRLASEAVSHRRDVWLVELASVVDPEDVPRAVASALGLAGTSDARTLLTEALSSGEPLLILDCCEHVIESVAHLTAELLGACPALRALATSREPLGIVGEVLHPVAPLGSEDAARLFVERARAVRPDIAWSASSAEVAQVCRRLDGLPLAIELAAARLRSMSLDALVERLDDRFELLSQGGRTAQPRHRTLRAVVAWSWDLLTDDERAAAERLSVAVGDFSARGAERIGVDPDTLHTLVDKSLVETWGERYRMLDTVREFGLDRLAETGRLDAERRVHAAAQLEGAERAERHFRDAGQLPWLARTGADIADLLAATRFAERTGDTDTAVRLAAVLGTFWTVRGDHAEAVRFLGDILRLPGAAAEDASSRLVTSYLLNAVFAGELSEAGSTVVARGSRVGSLTPVAGGLLALAEGDHVAGLAAMEEPPSREGSESREDREDRKQGEPDHWERALFHLVRSFLHGAAGDSERGAADLGAAAAGFRATGERWGIAMSLMSLAAAWAALGSSEKALRALDEAEDALSALEQRERALTGDAHDDRRVWLATLRIHVGDLSGASTRLRYLLDHHPTGRGAVLARICLADIARHGGDLDEAQRLLDLAGDPVGPAQRCLYGAAESALAAASGDLPAAVRYLGEAHDLAAVMMDPPMLARVAVGAADLLQRGGDSDGAARLLATARVLRGGPGGHDPDVARLTRELGEHRKRNPKVPRDSESALRTLRETVDRLRTGTTANPERDTPRIP